MKGKILCYVLPLLVVFQAMAVATPVMLASDATYADILVAAAAANKIGAEVYYVHNTTIPSDIYIAITQLNPEQIYIIGGPAVVSEDIESNLSTNFNVTRIWGMTRYGTAAEVAKYFWSGGTERAVLVTDRLGDASDRYAELVARAKDIAVTQQIPLLLIPKDNIPAEVEEALKTLGVKEVYIIGDVTNEVKEALENLGIKIVQEIANPKRAEEMAIMHAEQLVIVAAPNWRELAAAPFVPNGVTIFVKKESEIQGVVAKAKELYEEGKIKVVRVVGMPWLAEKICSALAAQNITHECYTGRRDIVAVRIMEKIRKRIRELREKYLELRERVRERLMKDKDRIMERCELYYQRGKEIVEAVNDTLAQARLQLLEALNKECKKALEENQPFKALRIAREMADQVKLMLWNHRNELENQIKEEILSETKPPVVVKKRIERIRKEIEKMKNVLGKLPEQCKEEIRTALELAARGEIRRAMDHIQIAKMMCENQKLEKLKEIRRMEGKNRKLCIQVITYAVNPLTGECKEFPTPCDVPKGWKIVRNCKLVYVHNENEECRVLLREITRLRKMNANSEIIEKYMRRIREVCGKFSRTNTLPKVKSCRPVCKNIDTRSEGWYNSCTGKLIKYAQCVNCVAICKNIGTINEGWYDSCTGELIEHAKCSKNAMRPLPVERNPELNQTNLTMCPKERSQVCTHVYEPVCAKIVTSTGQVIWKTYPNQCIACRNPNVEGYIPGVCKGNVITIPRPPGMQPETRIVSGASETGVAK